MATIQEPHPGAIVLCGGGSRRMGTPKAWLDFGGRPLRGLADAWEVVRDRCDAVFVCACDAPFITPPYIARLVALLGEHQAAVPVIDGYRQPLSALYRVGVDSMMGLLDALEVGSVSREELADVDSHLDAVRGINTPAQYRQAPADWNRQHNSA